MTYENNQNTNLPVITNRKEEWVFRCDLAKNYWTSGLVQEATKLWQDTTPRRIIRSLQHLKDYETEWWHCNFAPGENYGAMWSGTGILRHHTCPHLRIILGSPGHLDTWTHHGSPRHLGIPRQTRQSKAVRWEASTIIIAPYVLPMGLPWERLGDVTSPIATMCDHSWVSTSDLSWLTIESISSITSVSTTSHHDQPRSTGWRLTTTPRLWDSTAAIIYQELMQ